MVRYDPSASSTMVAYKIPSLGQITHHGLVGLIDLLRQKLFDELFGEK